ncbi:MAG: putative urate catabolism protein [Bradymonadia bacterium]|jgi:putative urate catabolism protein
MPDYPRDLVGHGARPPHPQWPNNARVAVSFVVNYEEGGENCVLHGDAASERFLSDIVGADAYPGVRHPSMESLYEYGTRAGVWRLMRLFDERAMHFTAFVVGMALERTPDPCLAMQASGHELASHGYRWIDYQHVDPAIERAHIDAAIAAHERILGKRPLGFYQGRTSPNSRRLAIEEGGFVYDCDSYNDDLPFYDRTWDGTCTAPPRLVVPYTLDTNDMRFATPQGFNSGTQFFTYLKDAFDVLYAEGETAPKMMSVGLHCRLSGRPGRAAALARFLDYVQSHDKVWVARRIDIARHWLATHPPEQA